MPARDAWVGVALGAALLLPPPGTDSKGRGFCRAWLAEDRPAKQAILLAAEERERGWTSDPGCRVARRATLRHELDAECRNWPRLMDFEVRAVVDGVLGPCGPGER